MRANLSLYLGIAFALILVYLLVQNGDRVKAILGSLTAANVGAIRAFQGRNPGAYVSSDAVPVADLTA